MYFTPQQLSGGPRYSFKTRAGNWVEDKEMHDQKLKNYMDKKETAKLCVNETQQKFAKSLKKVSVQRQPNAVVLFNMHTDLLKLFLGSNHLP